jgi:hypothetical protein
MNIFRRTRAPEPTAEPLTDEQALARYRYMLATAPPEDIERAHEEAFAQLSPEQRQQALQALSQYVPASELRGDDPASLARSATRAEIKQPGTIERAWGGSAPGLGSLFLYSLAGSFIGSAIAQSFFDSDPGYSDGQGGADGSAQGGEAGLDETGADGGDAGGGDYGGDVGGGDFGGGDFGGGDFGGI